MTKINRLISALLVGSCCAVALTAGAPAQNQSRTGQSRLNREIRRELVTLPFYDVFDWLQFEIKPDSTVVLSGQVTRPTTKSGAEARIKDIEGIESVVNNIEVLPLSPNDDRIRRRMYVTLFGSNSPLFRYGMGAVPSIHIIVKNGRVTLKGVVANQMDSQLAYTRARGVPGVFDVQNELQVEGGSGKERSPDGGQG